MREVCGIGIKHLHLLDPMLVERHPSILRGRRLAEGPEPEPAEPLPALPAQRPPIQQLAPALLRIPKNIAAVASVRIDTTMKWTV